MEHFFTLPVVYEGKELSYNARLVTFGYSYKFYIMIDGKEIVFEKDDEGLYRVVTDEPGLTLDRRFLQEIVNALTTIER